MPPVLQNFQASRFLSYLSASAEPVDGKQPAVLFDNDTEETSKMIRLRETNYMDLEGKKVTGSLALPAFSAKILIRSEEVAKVAK
jgi:hypothetical protein